MEPLDSDYDRVQLSAPSARPAPRTRALLILPVLGLLLALAFVLAAVFQLNLTDLVDSLMGLLTLVFVFMVGMLFWALAPRAEQH